MAREMTKIGGTARIDGKGRVLLPQEARGIGEAVKHKSFDENTKEGTYKVIKGVPKNADKTNTN